MTEQPILKKLFDRVGAHEHHMSRLWLSVAWQHSYVDVDDAMRVGVVC